MNKLLVARRTSQILVVALFLAIPWANKMDFHEIQGSLFSFNFFGVPFADPASSAQAFLSGALAFDPFPAEYLLGALLSLIIAFFLGRIFCGWICPYGLFSEILHSTRVKSNKTDSTKKRRAVWLCKCGWAAFALFICALFAYPLVTFVSMPGQLSLIPVSFWFNLGAGVLLTLLIIPLVALLVEVVAGRRIWCQYLCPQSVFLGFAAWTTPKFLPALRVTWTPKKCSCGASSPCAEACSLNLNPRHKNGPPRNDCVNCGDCVEACKKRGGALKFGLTYPKIINSPGKIKMAPGKSRTPFLGN